MIAASVINQDVAADVLGALAGVGVILGVAGVAVLWLTTLVQANTRSVDVPGKKADN